MDPTWYQWSYVFWYTGFNGRLLPNGGLQVATYLAQQKQLEDTGDVRCALNTMDIRRTVSTADLIDRQIAAQAVFRSMHLLSSAKRTVTNQGFLRVTYADGGSEQWVVLPYPAFSDGGISQPMPTTLKLGDGVVRPPKNPACAKGF